MTKTLKNTLCLFVLMSITIASLAQDRIIKTNSDTINCVIKEIGDLEIKYINPDISETIQFGIDKTDVLKIILANGKQLEFQKTMYNPDNYADNHKNILKTAFLAPLFNHVNIMYERSLRPGRSIEMTLGINGVGNDIYEADEEGVYFKLGYKFIKSPDYYIRGQRYAHILKGAYIRPEIAVSYYKYDGDEYYYLGSYTDSYRTRETNMMVGILLNFGKQWVIDNSFVIDWFVGVGYGFGDNKQDYGMHKAFAGGVDDFPIAVSSGIRVGWCF